MRLPFLKHLLDSVAALCAPQRIIIIGSSSLLPLAPHLGSPGQPLEVSLDADFILEPIDQETADMLMEAIGSESLFEKRNGYYADILRPAIREALPAGWESRLHPAGEIRVVELDSRVEVEFNAIMSACYRHAPPLPIRTFDALHLASAHVAGETEIVATDKRLRDAARLLGFSLFPA